MSQVWIGTGQFIIYEYTVDNFTNSILPIFTTYTNGDYTVSADSEIVSAPAWKAVDGSETSQWTSETTPYPHWFKVEFPDDNNEIVGKYRIVASGNPRLELSSLHALVCRCP